MKPICERFRLITIDMMGMGASSRPKDYKIDKFTAQEALDYLTDYIEIWRQILKLDQFYLACHSFGGFVCGNYACKYPQHIKKVLMLSPIGVRYDPKIEAMSQKERREAFKE